MVSRGQGPLTALPDAVLRPASGNAFENTVEQLARAIRLGVLADGELLPPERDLAERPDDAVLENHRAAA